ncbi:ABC transporter permease [Thalassotalea ganghwensis]
MKLIDNLHFSFIALARHKVRTSLLLLAVAISVTSVLLLTGLGEGARRFVEHEFSSLGNKMLVVLPGRKETTGGSVPIYGTTPRDLTIEDAQALKKISSVNAVAPIIAGTGYISYQGLSREVITIGSTPDFLSVRNLTLSKGKGLPINSSERSSSVIILGAKVANELFSNDQAVGQWVKYSGQRFRIIGVLEERGESLGLDLRDMVIIPVRSAENIFNSPSLFRILVQLKQTGSESFTEEKILSVIKQRHDGEDDVTVVSQNAILASFNNILQLITASIGAIAAISLVVAGFLIMNVSFISVSKRKQEIGLLKAMGATAAEVRNIFLIEALFLVGLGVIIGIALGYLVVAFTVIVWPSFPMAIPWWATFTSSFVALIIGVLFSWLPAKRAAMQDPVLALRGM